MIEGLSFDCVAELKKQIEEKDATIHKLILEVLWIVLIATVDEEFGGGARLLQ